MVELGCKIFLLLGQWHWPPSGSELFLSMTNMTLNIFEDEASICGGHGVDKSVGPAGR